MILKIALFISSLAYGQEQFVPARYNDFSGGLVTNVPASFLKPNQSPNLQNVVIDEPFFALKSRNGFTQCGILPDGGIPTALYQYTKSDGSSYLIVSDNTNYYQTINCVSFSTITTGQSSASIPDFRIVRDKLWIVNKSTWTSTWDGTTYKQLDGSASTPNPAPPKCAYLEFWKERVWCARDNSGPSTVYFSALTDNAGNNIDPSTGTASWPAVNAINVDQNGGCPIYGIRAYKNRLFVFKGECGIWEIGFNNEFDNATVKTFANVGSRFNTSIREMDGLLYFVGPDGIYQFDGSTTQRISDDFYQTFLTLKQPNTNQKYKTWDLTADWVAGTLSSTTATDVLDQIQLSTHSALISNGDFETGTLIGFSSSAIGSATVSTGSASGSLIGTGSYLARITVAAPAFAREGAIVDANGTKLATFDNAVCPTNIDVSAYYGQVIAIKNTIQGGPGGSNQAILVSSTFTATGKTVTYNCAWVDGTTYGINEIDDIKNSSFYSSGTWTSDIINAVSISTYGAFDATANLNSGAITYQIRTGTDTSSVNMAAWSNITPGSQISASASNIDFQVRAILYPDSTLTQTPEALNITVNYSQGDTTTQPIYSVVYHNRYWITSATGTSTTNNFTLVKAKNPLPGWMPFDLRVGPLVKWNGFLYGGASTHSALYLLDYGDNDNGAAINSYWESRDETWGLPNTAKSLQEIDLDFERDNANNISIGWSRNSGQTYSNRTLNMIGTGRGTARALMNGGNSTAFRFKISDSSLGERWKIYNISPLGIPYKTRE